MATIQFSDAVANPSLVASFDPLVDILILSDVSAADVKVVGGTGEVTLTTDEGSVTLPIELKQVTSDTTGAVRFIDGSVLWIGDGTEATVADDLANAISLANGNDQVRALGGNDTVYGGEGDDALYGNLGNDSFWTASSDSGNDTVFAGQGDDTIGYSGNDDDILAYGNLDDDSMVSGAGDDLLYGGQGDDTMRSGDGDDVAYGNAGNDFMDGAAGSDILFGGQGNDLVYGGFTNHAGQVYGNLGDDTLYASDGGDAVFAGQGNDSIFSGQDDDTVRGNLGNDYFFNNSANGIDTWIGGDGNDTLDQNMTGSTETTVQGFDDSADVLALSNITAAQIAANADGGAISSVDQRGRLLDGANIILTGTNGAVTIEGGAGSTLDGTNLILAGGTVFAYNVGGAAAGFDGSNNADFLIAGDNGDTITAGEGTDTLLGGNGNDLFALNIGFDGDDVAQGGDGTDTVSGTVDNTTSWSSNDFSSIEHFSLTFTGGAGIATIDIDQDTGFSLDASSFAANEQAYVSAFNTNAGCRIETGTGDDQIIGANVTVSGDTLIGGDGNDEIYGHAGADLLQAEEGTDALYGGAGADTMTGGTGADLFAYMASSESGFTTATVDRITDFAGGEDDIVFSGGGAALFDERLTDLSASTDLADAAQDAYTAAASVAANDAVLFIFGGQTYVYVNDGTGAFSTVDDLLVDITGFTGTITAADFA